MKKILIYIALPITVLVCWLGESRKFYCIDNRCITVWKTYGGTCYVIPRKYYGLIAPHDNFIKTQNTGDITIFWSKELPNHIIFTSDRAYSAINHDTAKMIILPYETDKRKYDSIFYRRDAKRVNDLKEEAHYFDVNIFDNYLVAKK